jgi:hypothetical protein
MNYWFVQDDSTTPAVTGIAEYLQESREAIEAGVGMILANGHGNTDHMPSIDDGTFGAIVAQPFFPLVVSSSCLTGRLTDIPTPTFAEYAMTKYRDVGFSQLLAHDRSNERIPTRVMGPFINLLAGLAPLSQNESPANGTGILWKAAILKAGFDPSHGKSYSDLLALHLYGDPSMVARLAADIDDDGHPNAVDRCPLMPGDNGDQDNDLVGDLCDDCPLSDYGQFDLDDDGKADACELPDEVCESAFRSRFDLATPQFAPRLWYDPALGAPAVIDDQEAWILLPDDDALRRPTRFCGGREYRVSVLQRRDQADSITTGVVCMGDQFTHDCAEFSLSDEWRYRTVRVTPPPAASGQQFVFVGARYADPGGAGGDPLFRISHIAVVKEDHTFQVDAGEAWVGWPSAVVVAPLEQPDQPDWWPRITGVAQQMHWNTTNTNPVCVGDAAHPTIFSADESSCAFSEQAGFPELRCLFGLNAALIKGERYLVALDYFTRHEAWTDRIPGFERPGASVRVADLPLVSQQEELELTSLGLFNLSLFFSVEVPLAPSVNAPARVAFIAEPFADGQGLWFCQYGFSSYYVDNVRIRRLP